MHLTRGKYLGANKRVWKSGYFSVSETEYHTPVYEGWHSHDNMHMSFIVEGGNCEKRSKQQFDAVPGTLLFYAPGEPHRNDNTLHPSRNINLEIENSFFSKYELDPNSYGFPQVSTADAKFALLKIYRECLRNQCAAETSAHLLLLNVLGGKEKLKTTADPPGWMHLVREILNDRWNENISLTELAAAVQVHPVTISKYFPRYFRCTLGAYLRKIRIEKSLALVKKGELSLTTIAYECGFCDQSHFIHAFKEMTGCLPRQYRNL